MTIASPLTAKAIVDVSPGRQSMLKSYWSPLDEMDSNHCPGSSPVWACAVPADRSATTASSPQAKK
jgi:hypothetical protein